METRSFAGRAFRCIVSAAIILSLTGCFGTFGKAAVKTKSETEIAVAEIKAEWLKRCEGLAGTMPENQTGNLLQDYADMASAFAQCIERHKALADYIEPVMKKERARSP